MAEFENVYIYVSDSLRYDYIPDSIAEEGTLIPTLIPAGYSPISFASLATGLDSRNHSVRSFYDSIQEETVFNRFENHCFYDHPDDALVRNVFRDYNSETELKEIEPPFFYIERAMDTHHPYGELGHGNEIPDEPDRSGTKEEQYQRGVDSTEEHFWRHVEELKERGLYEDTLIIFTSDHGEMLGEKYLGKEWVKHNKPIREELAVVPTVFLNHDLDIDRMRTIDIAPTALSILGKESIGDGIDLTQGKPETGYTMLQVHTHPLITTGCEWNWKNGEWKRGRGKKRTDLATLGLHYFEPWRQKLRGTKIAEIFGSDSSQQRIFNKDRNEEEDIEDLDV